MSGLAEKFPFRFTLGPDWRVRQVGEGLRRVRPALGDGADFHEVFTFLAPSGQPGWDDLEAGAGDLILLECRGTPRFTLRGQFVSANDHLFFLGTLWVRSLEELLALGLELKDIPPHESLSELLLILAMHERALKDTREMVHRLSQQKRELQSMTDLLNLQGQVDRALIEATDERDLVKRVLSVVPEALGLQFGAYWTEATPGVLTCESLWSVPSLADSEFIAETRRRTFPKGVGLPGGVWLNQAPTLFEAMPNDTHQILRGPVATAAGFISAFAFPVISEGHVFGVFEFFTSRPRASYEHVVPTFGGLGQRIGLYMQRRQAENDLRESRVAAAAASKMAALGEMAAGIAHEINNPLAIISGLTQQTQLRLDRGQSDAAFLTDQLRRIEATSNRIATIVRSLRAFAREGSQDPFEPVTATSLIDEALVFCRSRLKNNMVRLEIEDLTAGQALECRAVQIQQVLLNLLNNAHDAVVGYPDPWIHLRAEIVGHLVQFSVTDCGPGIPPEICEKILMPFFTTKGVGKGTGLGLSITTGIIKSHDGTLTIDLECPNTRFVVRLPSVQTVIPDA